MYMAVGLGVANFTPTDDKLNILLHASSSK